MPSSHQVSGVMTSIRICLSGTLLASLVLGAAWAPAASASEESVDQATQAALSLDAHPKRGAAVYAKYCTQCHGAQAHGDASRTIPALAGQRFAYLVRQLAHFSGGERDGSAMHKVVSQQALQKPQAWVDLASYLNNAPVIGAAQNGDGKHLSLGEGIFHEQCAACHSHDARGDADGFVPSLRSQHASYLVAQIHGLGAGRRHNVDENLMRFFKSLEDGDIAAVADYLSRLQGPGTDRKKMRNDGVVVD
jgi:cytochrome c553